MSIAALVKAKLQKINDRKAEKPGDNQHALAAYSDYSLYFQGADEALAAANADPEARRIVGKAMSLVDAEIAATEQRQALDEELNS
jgi:hypothetical protein